MQALHADVVIDLICFTLESRSALVERLRGHTGHLVYCGSIWRHGPSSRLPITESSGTAPVGECGIGKAATTQVLLAVERRKAARDLIGYAPRYQPDAAILEAVRWLVDHGQLELASPISAY
ncbi:hypothetical protein GCM10027613_26720 [Microlunatus endophyticus]